MYNDQLINLLLNSLCRVYWDSQTRDAKDRYYYVYLIFLLKPNFWKVPETNVAVRDVEK